MQIDVQDKIEDRSKRIRAIETALIRFTYVVKASEDHQRALYGEKDSPGLMEMMRDHAAVSNGAMFWVKTFAVAVMGQVILFGVGLLVLLIRVLPVLIELSQTQKP